MLRAHGHGDHGRAGLGRRLRRELLEVGVLREGGEVTEVRGQRRAVDAGARENERLELRQRGQRADVCDLRTPAEAQPLARSADLPADHDFITFRFTGIHYDAPEDVRFAYRLIGTDTTLRTTRDAVEPSRTAVVG